MRSRNPHQRQCGKHLFGSSSSHLTRLNNDDDNDDHQHHHHHHNKIDNNESGAEEANDQIKWNHMYYDGNARGKATHGFATTTLQFTDNHPVTSQVRVVSLDLDNTVWKTSPTIQSANDALAQFMQKEFGIISNPHARVERIMGDLFKANPSKYSPTNVNIHRGRRRRDEKEEEEVEIDTASTKQKEFAAPFNPPKSPVLLTQLRKDAIRVVLHNHRCNSTVNGSILKHEPKLATMHQGDNYSDDEKELKGEVDRAFELWTRVRHEAIEQNLASDVISCLTDIARIRSSEGHAVLIGAITDGNSDPRRVAQLGSFFDFCIQAEQIGISKPDARLYLHAVSSVLSDPRLSMVFATNGSRNNDDTIETANVPLIDGRVGSWWVHIGDDFIKDVVASKSLFMRSVWCRELIIGANNKTNKNDSTPTTPNLKPSSQSSQESASVSSRTVDELVKQVYEKKVLRMEVGSVDYLTDSFQNEFADAVVDRFADLGPLLHQWHNYALESETINGGEENRKDLSKDVIQTENRSTKNQSPGSSTPQGQP